MNIRRVAPANPYFLNGRVTARSEKQYEVDTLALMQLIGRAQL